MIFCVGTSQSQRAFATHRPLASRLFTILAPRAPSSISVVLSWLLILERGRRDHQKQETRGTPRPQPRPAHQEWADSDDAYTAQCKGVKGFPSKYENGLCSSNNSRQSSCPGHEEESVVRVRNTQSLYPLHPVFGPPIYFQIPSYSARPYACQRSH